METIAQIVEILIFLENEPTKNRLEASKSKGCKIYTSCQYKTVPKGDAATTETNQVLGSPLTVSTRKVEPITSKDTVYDEVSVLAKSRSEEGSQKPYDLTLKSHQE